MVEHDPDVMRASDRILDLGPGAGENGGQVIAAGTYDELLKAPGSLTGRYLSDELRIQMPQARRKPDSRQIKIFGAASAQSQKYRLVCSPGNARRHHRCFRFGEVHASARCALSSFVGRKEADQRRRRYRPITGSEVEGDDLIDDVMLVDQSPIGRTPRSNPVTYIKAFDGIRDLFASLPEAKKRGFTAGHFSFNIPGGRCETCQGDGTVTVEMQFLADVELVCEECKGARYKPQVLEVRYRGKNIHEVLNLTVKEALHFFSGVPKVVDKLRVLEEVGLGYLAPGTVRHHTFRGRGAANEAGGAPATGVT